MDNKCGCWAVLKRGVSGTCKSSASKDSVNTIPRTSLVYDAGVYSLACVFILQLSVFMCFLKILESYRLI